MLFLDFHILGFYTLKLALHNHYFPFWRQFFVLCLCNKTVKDLDGKKRDRDRETVTLGPAAPYVTIIWGESQNITLFHFKSSPVTFSMNAIKDHPLYLVGKPVIPCW